MIGADNRRDASSVAFGWDPCEYPPCKRLFSPVREKQRFCSETCRKAEWDRLHPRLDLTGTAPVLGLADPELRRNHGKAIAAANHHEDLETARQLALAMLGNMGPGTISDLRAYASRLECALPWHLNWTGSIFQHEHFEPTGRRLTARHKAGNARKVNEYRLSAEGVRAWEQASLTLE
jgi:hypothetical protein